MNNYYVNEGDFWESFNGVKSSLKYHERERMIDDYYPIQNDFITQHYIVVKNQEVNRMKNLNQKSNKQKLKVKTMTRSFKDSNYIIENLFCDFYFIDFKNDEENFMSNLDLDLTGRVEFQISINPKQHNLNYSKFFNYDDVSDTISKQTKFEFYRGIIIGSENYSIIDRNNQTYNIDRTGKSNVVKYDIYKCFDNYLNKFQKKQKSNN